MIEFDFSRSKLREQSIIEYRNDIIKYDIFIRIIIFF